MPAERSGQRQSLIFTKQVTHGDPCEEKNHTGIAAKSLQAQPAYPSVANALAAQEIMVGEEGVVMMEGTHPVSTDLLPGGAAVGNAVYITKADNALVLEATALTAGVLEAAYAKFGLISEIDTDLDIAQINLSRRDQF